MSPAPPPEGPPAPRRERAPRASRPDMIGYGIVPAGEGEGLLPWSWAVERLTRARNYFLATTRPDGRPHVMVLWGVWLDDDRFHFSTDRSSRKARNLAENPRCVLTPGDADEAVIVEGEARELADEAMRAPFLRAYQAKYDWDVASMNAPIFVLRPRLVFGQIEETFTRSATRWQFDD